MNEIIKRMNEIRARKAELRSTLETNAQADLDAITQELRELDEENAKLEKRKATIEGINLGTIPATEIVNPVASRSADNYDEEKEYRSAWLKSVRRLELSETEQRAMTTASSSAGAVVPTVTQNKIIEKVNQYCPLLDKIDLLRVPGGVKVPAEGTTTDAQKHTEGAAITADSDTLTSVSLSAYEVTKLVTISKSVEKMAIDAFENWLVNKIARKIAEKIGSLIISGTGSNEAQGINAITWGANNSVTVAKASTLTAANIQGVVALLNGGYDNGAEWLVSKSTFFTDFHPLMNNSKDNVVTEDNGVYRIMGYPVNFDDRMTAHEAILGNIYRGYLGNMPEDITVTSQFVTRENAYDFLGCAMFDGKVQATEAFVKIVKGTA
nr:MAG TPA: major capsid protein [Caudoviricetes sp.]